MKSAVESFVVLLTACMLAACLSPVSAGDVAGDLYAISPGPVDDPDIAWAPRIPALGDRVTLAARIRGSGEHPVDVRFIIEAPDIPRVSRSARPLGQYDPSVGYQEYRTSWQPEESGIYTVAVQVDPRNESLDSPAQRDDRP